MNLCLRSAVPAGLVSGSTHSHIVHEHRGPLYEAGHPLAETGQPGQKVKWPPGCCYCWTPALPPPGCLLVTGSGPELLFRWTSFFSPSLFQMDVSLKSWRSRHLVFVFKAAFEIYQWGCYHTDLCTCNLFVFHFPVGVFPSLWHFVKIQSFQGWCLRCVHTCDVWFLLKWTLWLASHPAGHVQGVAPLLTESRLVLRCRTFRSPLKSFFHILLLLQTELTRVPLFSSDLSLSVKPLGLQSDLFFGDINCLEIQIWLLVA